MKIAIDCRMYGLEHAGIGRYVMNLISNLKSQISNLGKWEFILLVRKDKEVVIREKMGNYFKIVVADYPHYSLAEQISLPLQLIKLNPDLVHFPAFNLPIFYWGKYIVTIHDLIKHFSRGRETTTKAPFLYWLKYLGYRVVFWNAVKRAQKILVPSEWVKGELIKQYHLEPEKLEVTYEGADKKFSIFNFQFSKKQEILKKYKIKKPFVIYTGSLYPHKNIERLIQSIKLLITNCQLSITLVIVCARSVFWERLNQKVKDLKAEKFINLAGFVPDEELAIIYQEAIALVQPSLMEGFDLTVVEAMAVGLPVVVSDIPVHREICGQAALYFDPNDPADIAEKIKFIIKNEGERERLKKAGLEQAKKYSWEKTAEQTIKAYEECK